MRVFTLRVQVAGHEHEVVGERRGRAIAVLTPQGIQGARSLHAATRIAANVLGPPLDQAERNGAPWGLYVEVGHNQAVYGDWPLLPGSLDDRRRKPSRLSKIRALWEEGDGAVAALNNAITIIEEFAEQQRAAA